MDDNKKKEKKWAPDAPIRRALHEGSIYDAMAKAGKLIADSHEDGLSQKIEDIIDNCLRLYNSYVDGSVSPDLDKTFETQLAEAHRVADAVVDVLALTDKESSARYKDIARQNANIADITELIAEYKQMAMLGVGDEASLLSLCNVLDCQRIEEHEVKVIFDLVVEDPELPIEHRMLVVGALAHNMISRHNAYLSVAMMASLRKMTDEPLLLGRMAVAVVADVLSWPERWGDNAVLLASLGEIVDGRDFVATVILNVFGNFAKTMVVGDVEKFFSSELVSELEKIVASLSKRAAEAKDGNVESGSLSITLSSDDLKEMFGEGAESAIDKIKMIEQWKRQGVDVGFCSMRFMKLHHFFRTPLNWLRPFCRGVEEVDAVFDKFDPEVKENVYTMLEGNPYQPDSDKYSVALSFAAMSNDVALAQSRTLKEAVANVNQKGEMSEDEDGFDAVDPSVKIAILSSDRFVKDLYRAYRLNKAFFGPTDAFACPQEAFDTKVGNVAFKERGILEALANNLSQFKCWEPAEKLWAMLINRQDGQLSQSKDMTNHAICLMKLGKYPEALEELKRVEIMDDSNPKVIRALSECYLAQENFKLASYRLEQLRGLEPDNQKILPMLAICYEGCKEPDKALNSWSEMVYLREDDYCAMAGKVRALLALGRDDDAEREVNKIPETDETLDTRGARALCHFVRYEFNSARDIFAVLSKKYGVEKVIALINMSRDMLLAHNISPRHIDLMTDCVRIGRI